MKRPLIQLQHGAELHRNVTRELFLSVPSGYAAAGTPDEALVVGGANADEPKVGWMIKVDALPGGFVSFTKCQAVWFSIGAAGNMYWQLSAYYMAEGEERGKHSDWPGLGVTATGGSQIVNVQEPANALTLVSLALGDYLYIGFERKGANALDTLDDEMCLLGLLFTYVAAQ